MDEKIKVPIKEYPTWIDCYVFEKKRSGELNFLYREAYQKEYVNSEMLKKLIKYDRTRQYVERYMNVLDLIDLPEETKNMIKEIHKMLNEDETVIL